MLFTDRTGKEKKIKEEMRVEFISNQKKGNFDTGWTNGTIKKINAKGKTIGVKPNGFKGTETIHQDNVNAKGLLIYDPEPTPEQVRRATALEQYAYLGHVGGRRRRTHRTKKTRRTRRTSRR